MDPRIQKYDGWTRLGPKSKNTSVTNTTGVSEGPNSAKQSSKEAALNPQLMELINSAMKPMGPEVGQELDMTQTGFLTSKSGKRFIRVDFSRKGKNGLEVAEGIIPGEKILKQNGFTEKEIASLEFYLKNNRDEIVKRAKELSNPLHWFG